MSWKYVSESLLLSASQCWFSKIPGSQAEMVECLKNSNILKIPEVIECMQKHDRSLFGQDKEVYNNKPVPIGNDEVMTTSSTHAFSLEILYSAIQTNSKVLDVGCGTGYISQCLAYLNPYGSVIAIDIHKNLILKAKKINTHSNLEFRHCEAFEVIEDQFDVIHVGFLASEDLYTHLCDKIGTGRLLCPVLRNTPTWVLRDKGQEYLLGDVGFSPMRVAENLGLVLDNIEAEIKQMYSETEKIIGRKPNITDLPKEIHEILRKRRVVQAKIKKQNG
jgi:protein-L-isoaspartate O-methyltransferase